MVRILLYVCTAVLLLVACCDQVSAQGVQKKDTTTKTQKENEANLLDVVDTINVVLFLFAGGPEEVLVRLVLMAICIVAMTAILGCCNACGFDTTPDTNRGTCGTLLTAYNSYTVGQEAWENKGRWGL